MRGLEMNKIAASVFVAGIIAMVCGFAAQILYHGSLEHGEHEEARGFTIEGAEEEATAGAGAVDAGPVLIANYLAAADAARGETTAKKCTSCHSFEQGGPDKVGPNLYGILGNHHAHKAGYAYSEAMAAKKGENWGWQELSEFLANPKKAVPGTKMGFAGIKKPEERADLLAYLKTISPAAPAAPKTEAAPAGAPANATADAATPPKGTAGADAPNGADTKKLDVQQPGAVMPGVASGGTEKAAGDTPGGAAKEGSVQPGSGGAGAASSAQGQ